MSRKHPAVAFCVALCALASPAAAQLYSLATFDTNLRTIDPATGLTLMSTPIAGAVSGFNGIAEDPTSGTIYVIHNNGAARELATLNPAAPSITPIGTSGFMLNALAFDGAGNLYALVGDGDALAGSVATVNKTTGAATIAIGLGSADLGGALTYDATSGSLVYWEGCPATIGLFVDPNTFATTPLPGLPSAMCGEVRGSTASAAGDFLVNDFCDQFYRISLAGAVTMIGSLDHTSHALLEVGGSIPCNGLYPGTNEDYLLTAGVNGSLSNCSQTTAVGGDVLFVKLESPGGTFNTAPPVITGQLFATGSTAPFIPITSPTEGIWVNPSFVPGPFVVFDGNAPPFNGLGLPAQGLTFQYFVGPFLTGVSVMLNAFAISPLAANNIFVASEGIEVQFM